MNSIIIAEERYGPKSYHFEDDDLVDRLNNRYTIGALVIGIFVITGNIQISNPINCWTPAEFKGQHDGYANSICWLKGSYYLPTEEITIPDRSQPRIYYVSYYQWTAFILLGMALLFLVPKAIWHTYSRRRGLNIRRLVQVIKDKPDAGKGVDLVKNALKLYLDTTNNLHRTICCGCRCSNFYAGYTAMYFTVKILYAINTLTQFIVLNTFLSFNFTHYGFRALNRLFQSEQWFESPRFPRVTMCDFMVRRLGSNQHWYAVQCTLPINLYNEKIFLILWLWLLILTIFNLLSIISWIVALTKKRRLATIIKYLRVARDVPSKRSRSSNQMDEFEEFTDYLHLDGFLIFRIFAHNTDDLVAGQIIEHIYRSFQPPPRTHTSDV